MNEIYWMIVCGTLGVLLVIMGCAIYILELRIKRTERDLTTANTIIEDILDITDKCEVSMGCCMCGDNMQTHDTGYNCGHSAVDMGAYHFAPVSERAHRWVERGY